MMKEGQRPGKITPDRAPGTPTTEERGLTANKRNRSMLLCVICVIVLIPVFALAGIRDTKHNLSVSGPGPIKAASETQICIFCHAPHNASPVSPLWNHDPSTALSYINYWSPTLKAYASRGEAPPIDGYSKLCLGCHDGTVALGALVSRQADVQMAPDPGIDASGRLLPGAAGYMGTDLSGHHPVSFIFDSALATLRNSDPALMPLKWPVTDQDVKLYPTQGGYGVQCTSCHEPHGSKGTVDPPFWQKATFEEVCIECHDF